MLTSELVRAARALLRWEQRDLADASGVSLPSVKRLEVQPGPLAAQARTVDALRRALEVGGVQFIEEGESGAGVRLRRRSSRGFIFDDQGKHVASILGSDVVDVSHNRRIGIARDGGVYTLDDAFVGTLRSPNTVARTGSLTAEELSRLFRQA